MALLKAKIKEIFTSVQGEGPFIGVKQVFVRFCACNLNCAYCDTDFSAKDAVEYDTDELAKIINSQQNVHSVAFTGGEPLMFADFLAELLPKLRYDVYLETNATLFDKLEQIIDYVKFVSADIKLESSASVNTFAAHEKFFEVCAKHNKETFVKIVFNDEITDEEIAATALMARKFGLSVILQPQMRGNDFALSLVNIEKVFDKYSKIYDNVRLIPQVHKFLGVR